MGIPTVEKMEIYPVARSRLHGAEPLGRTCTLFHPEHRHPDRFQWCGRRGRGAGGEKITKALEDVKHLVLGTRIADYKQTLNKVRAWLSANIKDDVRGLQTFDLRTGVHVVTAH